MSEINLLLVRHGEASESWGNHSDPGLSDQGIKQSISLLEKNMVKSLDSYNFVSSPKLRARLTAEPLIKKFGKKLLINETYSEIPSNNIDNTKKRAWLTELMNTDIANFPENVALWRTNIIKHSLNIAQNTIIFTHFMVVNALISALLKKSRIMYFHPDYVSITKITFENYEVKSITLGDEKKTVVNL